MPAERIPGLTAIYHASMNKPLLLWPGVPWKIAVGFFVVWVLSMFLGILYTFLIWRLILIGIVAYLGIALLVASDHRMINIIVRYFSYPECLE